MQTEGCKASEQWLSASVHQQDNWDPETSFGRGFPFYASYQHSLSENETNTAIKHVYQQIRRDKSVSTKPTQYHM